jgi:hypothetical protein
MRKALVLAVVLAASVCAQQRDVFKVDFTVRDSGDAGGKTGRKYSLMVYGQEKGVFKIGNRVPVTTGTGSVNSQYTYVDVGVNLDVTLQEMLGRISMRADVDLSTAVMNEKMPGAAPTISQIKLAIFTSVPPAKPTIVASFDDPVTARKFDIEAVVNKVN